ncbi:unnamed protein product [Amoebophrya sp. A120]|nr:unnamed protein product [Amoebophrya sp. A120]|eukprot:GSA120T00017799001.1
MPSPAAAVLSITQQFPPSLDVTDFVDQMWRCKPGFPYHKKPGAHPRLIFGEKFYAEILAKAKQQHPELTEANEENKEEASFFQRQKSDEMEKEAAGNVLVHLSDTTYPIGRVLWSAKYPFQNVLLRQDQHLPESAQPDFYEFCLKAPGRLKVQDKTHWYKLTVHHEAAGVVDPKPIAAATFKLEPGDENGIAEEEDTRHTSLDPDDELEPEEGEDTDVELIETAEGGDDIAEARVVGGELGLVLAGFLADAGRAIYSCPVRTGPLGGSRGARNGCAGSREYYRRAFHHENAHDRRNNDLTSKKKLHFVDTTCGFL